MIIVGFVSVLILIPIVISRKKRGKNERIIIQQ
jgi:hypothetical protein